MLQPSIDTNQSIINYLNQKLSFYTDDEMIKNLNKSLDLYDEKKLIELTYLFVVQFPSSKNAPQTIVDESGNRIKEENANIYLNKESDVSLNFPKWSKSYFIKQSFEDALKNKFEATTKRSLADKLTKFNVDEYSYLPVLRSLVLQAGTDIEKAIDLIKVLYASWESREKLDVDIWNLQSRPKIQVVNRNGQVIDASSCYLGNEYDNALGERLLKCINITDFIAEPKVFGLDNKELTALRKFFNEIFVASFPKIELIDLPYMQRKKYLEFNKTKYSLLKVDKTWEAPYDYEDLGINTVKVYTIANIEDILSESKSEDILLWTVKDRLLNDKLGKYNESEKSFIKGRPYKKVDDRFVSYNQMLSYLNFIFSTSKWIEAEDGIKKKPKELVIDSSLPKAFSQFIATPIFDENLLIQNGISKFSALDILLKLGAVDDIKKLDKELIYKILLELPEKDITNEFGGSIYDWLNKKFDTNDLDSLVANNTNYSKFLKEGKLLCYGNRGYVPVAEVSYIDKKVVCESILQKMNTMKLHRRAGGPKIEKMFGAKSFKGVEISNISVTKCDDKTQQEFNKAYEILKPYIYADRYYKDKSGVNLRALQNIDIILCSNIIIMYNNKPFEVGNYENIYSIGEKEEKSIAYIKIPDGKSYYKLSQETDFQMSLAEIISAILDINGKENYQILIGKTEVDMRKIFLASNTEENLKLAKEKLCDKDYFKRKFWHSVGSTYGIKLTEDTELDSILNQLDINISEWPIDCLDVLSGPSLPSLIKLFKHLDIDIDDFNKYSAEQLNLTSHYKQQFKCLQDRFQQKYLSYKINNYCKYKEDFSDIKKHYLFELFDNFNPDNSVKVNVQDEFEKALDVKISHLEAVQKQDIEELYNILESKYQTDIEPSPIPVLRPSEDDVVKKRIENMTVIDMLDIKITKTNLQSHNHSNSTKRHTTIADETEREKRIGGRICEELVYKKLCEEFGKDNVLWVSGNAKLAGINSKGSDDYGYDISYNDGCNIRKVEVKKTSSNSISFFISESEIRFAQRPENKDSYEIRCVKLDDNNNAIIKRLGNIFDLPNGEDLYNNSLFSIRSKNDYEIIAKELADNEDVSRA